MKIFIDPGHNNNGWDTGAMGNGLREQDVTIGVAKILADMLKKAGFDVMLSRNSQGENLGYDLASSLGARYKAANNWYADLFVSVHCNAFSTPAANGTETLVFNQNSKAFPLAKAINSEMVELGLADRGVKPRPDLAVLKYTNMPAVLVELAFITNPNDAIYLANRQEDLARAIYRGILAHTGVADTEDIHWAKSYYDFLISKGFQIHEQEFDRAITRGEALKLIALAAGYKSTED